MKNAYRVCLLVIACLVMAGCSSSFSTPEELVKAYIEKAYAGDADALMKLIHYPEEAKKPGAKDMIRGKLKELAAKAKTKADEKGGVKEIIITSTEYNQDKSRATVGVKIIFKNEDAKPDNQSARTIKTDDGWKLFI